MKWKHFISPSLCIKMLYIKNMKSWEKGMATASPAAAVFFLEIFIGFYPCFRVVSGITPRKVFKYATVERFNDGLQHGLKKSIFDKIQ